MARTGNILADIEALAQRFEGRAKVFITNESQANEAVKKNQELHQDAGAYTAIIHQVNSSPAKRRRHTASMNTISEGQAHAAC